MAGCEVGCPRGNAGILTELGGPGWGLLPAFLFIGGLAPFLPAGLVPSTLFILMATLMASYDVASFRIPNALNGVCALTGLILSLAGVLHTSPGWALLGGLTGFGLMAVFFFMGAVGAGDVKALGALCCFMGPQEALYLFILTTLAGGVLAIIRLASARRGLVTLLLATRSPGTGAGLHLPYGLAIWSGSLLLLLVVGVPL